MTKLGPPHFGFWVAGNKCNKRSSAKATAGAMSPFDLPKAHMIWLLVKLFPSNHKCNKVIIHELDILHVAMDILLKLNCKLLSNTFHMSHR